MTRWIAAGGAFVVSLDSMVNIAFPAMAAAFALPAHQIRWVIVCYVGLYAVLSLAGGALGDRVGHRRVFAAGLVATVLGYVLAAMAPAFGWLLAGRAVQGLGGGFVYGTAPALVTLGAASRARALGFLNAAIGLAFALGPVVAGLLVERWGWRAVFHARVPLGLLVLVWSLSAPPGSPVDRAGARVRLADVTRAPVLVPAALAFLAYGGIFAIWLLAPFYLVERRGLDARLGGLLFMLTPLGMTLGAPLASRLMERAGFRFVMTGALALEAGGLAALGAADRTTALAVVGAGLLAAGLGLGVFLVPNMTALMQEFPASQQGAAGGLAFLSRTLGIVAGVLVLAEVFAAAQAALGFDTAFAQAMWLAAAAVMAAGLLAALARAPR